MSMSRLLNGHLHPLLVHFPIGLVLTAAMAETVALATGIKKWRVVAVANLRLGSVFALAAAATGWLLAASSAVEDAHTLGWHQWLGTGALFATLVATVATAQMDIQSGQTRRLYYVALAAATLLVAATGHIGGVLVWGVDFLRQ